MVQLATVDELALYELHLLRRDEPLLALSGSR